MTDRLQRKKKIVLLTLLFMSLYSCSEQQPSSTEASSESNTQSILADLVFLGDHIITMDPELSAVNGNGISGVAVQGDRIVKIGSEAEVSALAGENTRVIQLGERALLPGFIDAHGHFFAFANRLQLLDLSSPPVGEIESIDDIVAALRDWIERQQIPAGELIVGTGYDDSLLAEVRHPNREDLDRASTEHPIVLRHVSGHLLAVNSLALSNAGVTAATEDPAGGIIRRRPDSNEPDGVMEETALGLFPSSGGNVPAEQIHQLRQQALQTYASYGITTIQDANLSPAIIENLEEYAAANPFPQDIVVYVWANGISDAQLAALEYGASYRNGLRFGGVKFTLDGSPQGRTAWLTRPYTEGPPGQDSDYVAYPSYEPELYLSRTTDLIRRGIPILAHANGDAAIDLMLDGVEQAIQNDPDADHRSVIIHSQLTRPDHLPRFKTLNVVPSYYSVHPFFWGDWHRLSFGEERAAFISPVASTAAMDIPYTIHNDTPVVPPDMMRLVAITVNRKTRSGFVLGPQERATVEQALHAITLGAAYQYFEENEKGSITEGKRADLVILEANPFDVDPENLDELAVIETFARGKSIYHRDQEP